MKIQENMKIGELVAENYRYAEVFNRYGMDFCCGGGKTIAEACSSKKVEMSDLLSELNQMSNAANDQTESFNDLKLTTLVDHIVDVHHTYLREKLPLIGRYLDKVEKVHQAANPELKQVNELFSNLSSELEAHLLKEETVLFPYVKEMEMKSAMGETPRKLPFGSVENPVTMMLHEHQDAGDALSKLASLTNNYTPPDYACNTYIVAYKLLQEMEGDLHKHIHLENNILFPKAIMLEKKLLDAVAN